VKTTGTTQRHPLLALATGFVAVSALAGAVALATGLMDMGAAVNTRFPFHSTLAASFALALVVALPMALAAYLAGTGDVRAADAAMVAGALLVGWIAVQLVVIRTFSWLQPAMALAGALVFLGGLLVHIRTTHHRHHRHHRRERSQR
jgi:hypothetical protein